MRLVALRDNEIRRAFPDTPEDKCLLNPRLLDEFVLKRPKTRDDWFERISLQSRTSVDSKQVGQYLDCMLEILRESD